MKKLGNSQILLNLILVASLLILSPLLMAFMPYPLGQIPPSTFPWIIQGLEIIGKWVLENLPIVFGITGEIFNALFHRCELGTIIPDANNPLNGVYSGCLECVTNGYSHKIYTVLMSRPSIDAPWDIVPSSQNICP